MKFDPGNELKKSIEYTASTVQRSARQTVTSGIRKVVRLLGIRSLSQQVLRDVKEIGRGKVGFHPSSRKDYVDFGRFYVSKVLLVAIPLLILLCVAVLVRFVYPHVMSAFFTRDLPVTSSLITGYNGKVRLFSEGGTLLFQGKLEEGRINGTGTLYDTCGNLVYTGDFQEEQYNGTGALL